MNVESILRHGCPILAGVDGGTEAVSMLAAAARVVEVPATQVLYAADEAAEDVFVVAEGSLATLVHRDWGEERVLEEAHPGDVLGLVEVVSGADRLAEVRALEDSRVLAIPRRAFEGVAGSHDPTWERVMASARTSVCRILTSRQLGRLLGAASVGISDPLRRLEAERDWLDFERDILADLEKDIGWVELRRGDYLFRQGDPAEDALVVVSGVLEVRIATPEGIEKAVGEVRTGEVVGEVALFSDQARTASVVAVRDAELFRIPRAVFARIAERFPRILLGLYRASFQRLVRNSSVGGYRPRRPNTALLRANPDVDPHGFIEDLAAAMSAHGEVGRFSSASVDEALGRPGIANTGAGEGVELRLVQWLNGQESHYDRLLYEADAEWTAWTDRCVRQADQVLVVADVANARRVRWFRDRVTGAGQRWSLVLLHPPDTDRPRESARWLDDAGLDSVYHVRRGHAGDLGRLARILCGRAVGLVLGGGGARGSAHLGLLRSLEEHGIEVDMVGGTSMGAPLAAWMAQGRNSADIVATARRCFRSLLDPTLPLTSLLAGRRITDGLYREAGDWDIEDLWIPFFCVSTNLTSATPMVHRRGNAARAIRCSLSIPGVLPPVPNGSDLLVDGCVLNNLPIDVMRDANPSGRVIASDVVAPRGLGAKHDYGMHVSGFRQALGRILPWLRRPATPSVGVVILQSTMVGSELARRRVLELGLVDYYQNIHVPGLGMLQFEEVEHAADVGYRASVGPVGEWKAAGFPPGTMVGS